MTESPMLLLTNTLLIIDGLGRTSKPWYGRNPIVFKTSSENSCPTHQRSNVANCFNFGVACTHHFTLDLYQFSCRCLRSGILKTCNSAASSRFLPFVSETAFSV
jgi:hypothetical protein